MLHELFAEIDNEQKAYWLGFLMADGNIYVRPDLSRYNITIRLSKKDLEQLIKWKSFIQSSTKIRNDIKNCVTSFDTSKQMCLDLIKLGCVPRKSLILEFPKIKTGLLPHFIRGYFDGDGGFYIRRYKNPTYKPHLRMSFVGTNNFLTELKVALSVPNIKLYEPNKKSTVKRLDISGNKQIGRIVSYLYKDATVFLQRKYDTCSSILGNSFETV